MSNFKLIKIIERKKNGEVLSSDDIAYFIDSVVKTFQNDNDDLEPADRCQIGAMLMAIYLKGMNSFETTELTQKMKSSGHVFSWPEKLRNLVVDKHSTGGVGDKVSLVLAPALAALGLKVPMISGRSLGHTGGTLDKLESIPGFRTLLSKSEIENIVETVGCCIVGQTEDCVPADKVLYHCREITSTVDCSPLIIASIASKKLSEGLSSIVYDVKFGRGSIFKSKEKALETGRNLIKASQSIKASAVFTSMESPLGKAIGNSLEVLEALECLKGCGSEDILQITSVLGGELVRLTGKKTKKEGEALVYEVLKDGRALKKFHDMISLQGVSKAIAAELCYGDANSVLTKAPYQEEITYSGVEGYVSDIDPLLLANMWKEESFLFRNNPGVGFIILKSVGEKISPGDVWLTVHQGRPVTIEQRNELAKAVFVQPQKTLRKLIDKRIYYSDQSSLVIEDYN